MINVLKRAAPAELHANPELVSSEVGSIIGHDVGMSTVLHHDDFLLNDAKVIALFKFDDFDGRKVSSSNLFSLKIVSE